jgi:hypothetical protein
VAVALAREQVTPHLPQFESVLSGVSQPLLSLPSQSPQPLLQMQEPAEQKALAPQLRPHMPQCAAEVLRFVSQPLLSLPSQLPQPALQDRI